MLCSFTSLHSVTHKGVHIQIAEGLNPNHFNERRNPEVSIVNVVNILTWIYRIFYSIPTLFLLYKSSTWNMFAWPLSCFYGSKRSLSFIYLNWTNYLSYCHESYLCTVGSHCLADGVRILVYDSKKVYHHWLLSCNISDIVSN